MKNVQCAVSPLFLATCFGCATIGVSAFAAELPILPGTPAMPAAPRTESTDFERGLAQINKLAGCYVVDYSFTEIESLKPDYALDRRIYEVNVGKTTRELLLPIRKSATEMRLQHILFSTGKDGKVQFVMKHEADDWEYQAPFQYDFVSPNAWDVKRLAAVSGQWTRKVTNLDDGLRHQCTAPWDFSQEQAQWKCANFAPIPGRETRDMGRKDYNTLDRVTHLVDYGASFLERQDNVKTILADGTRTPLARELGKTWFVRQPKEACSEALAWATPRLAFWKILAEEWERVLAQAKPVREVPLIDGQPRYAHVAQIEERYFSRVANDASAEQAARAELRAVFALSMGTAR